MHAYNGNAQKALDQQISIELKNEKLGKVLNRLEELSGVSFTFSRQKIASSQKVSLKQINKPLKEVLDELLTPLEIEYEIFNEKSIVLRDAKDGNTQSTLPAQIQGKITDENGEPLIGATVQVKGTSAGTITDAEGNFTLDAPEDAVLVISYVGYKSQEVRIGNRSVINVALKSDSVLEGVTVLGSRGKAKNRCGTTCSHRRGLQRGVNRNQSN